MVIFAITYDALRRIARILLCFLPAVSLLLFPFLAGCKKPIEKALPVAVRVKQLRQEPIITSTRFSATVEPKRSVDIAFKLPGTVDSVYQPEGAKRDVQAGDSVPKDAVLARLDEGDLRRAKESAEVKLAGLESRVMTDEKNFKIAQRDYDRFLSTARSVSQKELDDAAAKLNTSEGALDASRQELAYTRVQKDQAVDNWYNRELKVPFTNAIVAEKHIEPGERVASGQIAFRLIDISVVHVTFGVPDTMVGEPALAASAVQRVYLGQKLDITADAFEGRSFSGTVTKIAPQADSKTRTFATEVSIVNPLDSQGQYLIRPGMIVTVRVGVSKDRMVMLLPLTAIHRGRNSDNLVVYEVVTEGGRDIVRTRKVVLGGIYNNAVEVVPEASEAKQGSRIVVTTADRLADGAQVRVIGEESEERYK